MNILYLQADFDNITPADQLRSAVAYNTDLVDFGATATAHINHRTFRMLLRHTNDIWLTKRLAKVQALDLINEAFSKYELPTIVVDELDVELMDGEIVVVGKEVTI